MMQAVFVWFFVIFAGATVLFSLVLFAVGIYLGINLLIFLISVAVACYLLKSETHKEDK